MKKMCLSLVFCLAVTCSPGATVQWPVATIFEEGFLSDYGLYVSFGFAEDVRGTYAGYNIIAQSSLSATLSGQNWATLISYPHMWRQMNEGDLVDAASMIGNYHDYFFCLWDGHYDDVFKPLTINQDQTVYLGFVIGYMYGWVELGYDPTKGGVYVVGSAIDIDGDPIQIGFIPEPSTALLALMGLAVFGLRRRKAR